MNYMGVVVPRVCITCAITFEDSALPCDPHMISLVCGELHLFSRNMHVRDELEGGH